jgi:hypothetical protein
MGADLLTNSASTATSTTLGGGSIHASNEKI